MARKERFEDGSGDEENKSSINSHYKNKNQTKLKIKGLKNSNKQSGTGSGSKGSKFNSSGGSGGDFKTKKSINSVEESHYLLQKQLEAIGLYIREMPGDGNCLFRALSDQLEGNTNNHLTHRRAVVEYMIKNREDFEPFVEDDQPFEKYVHSLSQPGTFSGNDCIVAFARLHNVTVVIHQLDKPTWLIHPSLDGQWDEEGGREVHIAYHNGDHYNSIRTLGDYSLSPTNIKLSGSKKNKDKKCDDDEVKKSVSCKLSPKESSYFSNLEWGGRDESVIEELVEQVQVSTNYYEPNLVRDALFQLNFDLDLTINYILNTRYFISEDSSTINNEIINNYAENNKISVSTSSCPVLAKSNRNEIYENLNTKSIGTENEKAELISSPQNLKDSKDEESGDIDKLEKDLKIEVEVQSIDVAKNNTKSKPLSRRQKKDLKKKERKNRKKESEQVKNLESQDISPSKLGSLII